MNMRTLVVSLLLFSAFHGLFAQKVGFVDTEKIMSEMPKYKKVQEEVDKISQQWQQELEGMYANIERMYREYTAQEVLLSEDIKLIKQEEIFKAEREAKEFRESKFGYNGAIFQIQDQRMKPVQEEVFKAVETVAQRRRVNMVFDKAGEITWLYTDANYDLTEDVKTELGVGKKEN